MADDYFPPGMLEIYADRPTIRAGESDPVFVKVSTVESERGRYAGAPIREADRVIPVRVVTLYASPKHEWYADKLREAILHSAPLGGRQLVVSGDMSRYAGGGRGSVAYVIGVGGTAGGAYGRNQIAYIDVTIFDNANGKRAASVTRLALGTSSALSSEESSGGTIRRDDVRSDPEYQAMLSHVRQSVAALQKAILAGHGNVTQAGTLDFSKIEVNFAMPTTNGVLVPDSLRLDPRGRGRVTFRARSDSAGEVGATMRAYGYHRGDLVYESNQLTITIIGGPGAS